MTETTFLERLEKLEAAQKNERTQREQLAQRVAQLERQIGIGPGAQKPELSAPMQAALTRKQNEE